MSTFYLLPSRPFVGACFAHYLEALFPGLHWDREAWANLAEGLDAATACHPDVFVVYREEMPPDEDPVTALTTGFGAEPGDEVIELHAGACQGEWTVRRWQLNDAA